MAKKTKTAAEIPVSKPAQSVVRVGEELTRQIRAVVDYGKDDQGPFAIVEFGDPWPDGGRSQVRSIDLGTEGDEVDRIVFSPTYQPDAPVQLDPPSLGEKIGGEFAGTLPNGEHTGVGAEFIKSVEGPIDALVSRVADLDFKPIPPIMVREKIHVQLTDLERATAARAAAALLGEMTEAEEIFKNESAAHKAKVKEVKSKIAALTEAHNTGLQYQTVTCEQQFDRDAGLTRLIYRGKVYRERAMTDRELASSEKSPLFGDMPDKVDPSALPSPKVLAGDDLARHAEARLNLGVDPLTQVPKGKPTKKPPISVERITMPEHHAGAANGVDAEIAATMREETRRGGKKDMTVS